MEELGDRSGLRRKKAALAKYLPSVNHADIGVAKEPKHKKKNAK